MAADGPAGNGDGRRWLRRIARRYMRGERAGNTIQTTALVNVDEVALVSPQPEVIALVI